MFNVSGSAPEPYTVKVSFDPFSISCTCQAGLTGTPCKHRIRILKGYSTDTVGIPPNKDEVLHRVNEIAQNLHIFELLDEYERVKKEVKENNLNSEKLFKKYREEMTRFALQQVKTDKNVAKAKVALDDAVEKGISTEKDLHNA
jgi:hypothetical protein